jgi:DNA-binding Lrp family transcriptional regulator
MDEIDRKLLIDLQKNCRVSYQELSRTYGISANAIRRRILNLEETGEIAGYTVALAPAMVGVERIFGLLSSDGSRDELDLVDEIGSHQNIMAAAAYTNGIYALVAEYKGPEELLEVGSYLRRIEGIKSAELHPVLGTFGVEMELSNLHLRVLKCLLDDPRMSVVEIAKESGLTARRVRRLLTQLEDSGAVRFRALVELGAASSIPFIAKITWDEKTTTYARILEWIEKTYPLNHWESFISASEPILYSLLAAHNLTEVTELTRDIRKHTLVRGVTTIISKYHKFFPNYRMNKLREMIRSVSSAGSGA